MNDPKELPSLSIAEYKKELARLKALRSYQILDTPPNVALDALTKLTANLLGVPIALIDLVDESRIWSKSHFGTEVAEYKIHPGFCSSAIAHDAPYVITNAKTDPRCANHPLVLENGVSFYAGVPLKTHDGFNIGMFCVIDFEPHGMSDEQLNTLKEMAIIAMEIIELCVKEKRNSEILAIENKFKEYELQNQLILNSTIEGIHVVDLNGIVVQENSAALKMLGRERGDLRGKHAHETLHHHHADNSKYPVTDCPVYKTLHDGVPRNVTNEVFWKKDGSSFPVEYSTSPLLDLNGKLCGTTVVFRDITARKANEAKIQQLAYFDSLTGLPNRSLFLDRLEQEIRKAHRNHKQMSLMFIDLDRFKEINDTLGHDVGDLLLIEAAKRLRACLRETETVARLGGDEFTVIIGEINGLGPVETIAEKIISCLAKPFFLNDETIYLSASIGITVFPDDALTSDELLKNADRSMYAAKKAGRNQYQYFTASMQEHATSRLRMISDLHLAIKNKEFFLVYQPIVSLATGEIKKAEALIRWNHPIKGVICPLEFISIAEEVGLISEIGKWVFEESARQIKSLQRHNIHDFQISINKSPVQFNAIVSNSNAWFTYLKSLGLSGDNICIEITEGLLLDSSEVIQDKLNAFRSEGFQIAVDDFGTGYSSLSYLNKFSVDYIKIDRSFVNNLSVESDNYALCEAMIAMAHKLKIKVVAKGIETELQLELLTNSGCDYGQGYYLSKPLSKVDFESFLIYKQKRLADLIGITATATLI